MLAVIAVLLGMALTGCGSGTEAGKPVIRICFDTGDAWDETWGDSQQTQAVTWFMQDLKVYAANQGVEAEFEADIIPSDQAKTTERAAVLQRIRTELMTGGGPDVFVINRESTGYREFRVQGHRLFPYVEKQMEQEMFLPLDDLLPALQVTDWENDIFPQVMDAGRDSQGRLMVMPLIFTMPLTLFRPEDAPTSEQLTWDGAMSSGDERLARNQLDWFWGKQGSEAFISFHESGLPMLLGELADFDKGELTFTEEQLVGLIVDNLKALKELPDSETRAYSSYADSSILTNSPVDDTIDLRTEADVSMRTIGSFQGGSTGEVTQYAAINRNTKAPAEAFFVLDCLLSPDFQTSSDIMREQGMLSNQRGLHPEKGYEYPNTVHFTSQQYAEWQNVAGQITAMHFRSPIDGELEDMMEDIRLAMTDSVEFEDDVNEWLRENQFWRGDISEEDVRKIVHKYYKRMQRLLDES